MPVFMVLMMVVCFFMMRGHFGSMMSRRGAGSHGGGSPASALDVLNKRYAEGEISEEEYEKKRSTITRQDRP
jgi:putative membrane protein